MSNNPKVTAQESMDLAEDSRQEEWLHPSFVGSLFAGQFRPSMIYPFPEQAEADKKIGDEFCAKFEKFLNEHVDADKIDEDEKFPEETLNKLKDFGAFGMKIAKEYGGLGFSQMNYIRALQIGAGHCGSTVAFLSAHQSIGCPQPLKIFGTPEQKKKWLPQLTKKISAFALTEPGVGSDPAGMMTEAKPTEDGEHFIINGEKLWCTNGAVAEIMIVMARTPDKIVNGKPRKQISAFIVESNMPGFEVKHRCRFQGLNGIENGWLKFKDVKVPKENLIGNLGDGLKIALVTLNAGRLSLPGACIGLGKKNLEAMRYWTKKRFQWGTEIGNHEEIATQSATIAANTFAQEALTHWTCLLVDKGGADIRLEAAIAKLFCTEKAWADMYRSIQIRGGRGYERAPSLKIRGEANFALERAQRDIRINTILEGSTEIMHLFTAREALDLHMRQLKPIIDPRTSIGQKFAGLLKMATFYTFWYPKLWFSWDFFPRYAYMGKLGKHYRYIGRTSRKLARTTFHLMMRYQLGLEKKQMALGRVVEIGSELFAMAAACSKAHTMVKKNPSDKTPVQLADLFCNQAKRRIKGHFKGVWCNDDSAALKVSKGIMAGKYEWLEEGRMDGNVTYPEDK